MSKKGDEGSLPEKRLWPTLLIPPDFYGVAIIYVKSLFVIVFVLVFA